MDYLQTQNKIDADFHKYVFEKYGTEIDERFNPARQPCTEFSPEPPYITLTTPCTCDDCKNVQNIMKGFAKTYQKLTDAERENLREAASRNQQHEENLMSYLCSLEYNY